MNQKNEQSVLIISAHADDHVAHAGTLFKLQERGFAIDEIILTNSSEGRDFRDPTNGHAKHGGVHQMRQNEFVRAIEFFGTREVVSLYQEDLALQYSKSLMFQVVEIVRRLKPRVGLIHAGFDWHPDHHQAFKISSQGFKFAATDIQPELGQHWRTPVVLATEGSLTIQPDVLIDVTDQYDKKMDLWRIYESQAAPREVAFEEAIMDVRGYQTWKNGLRKAEAFHSLPDMPIILFEED